MIVDLYSGRHTATQRCAVDAYEVAVWNVVAHRPAAGAALAQALSVDPDMVAALALRGLANVMLARSETIAAARGDLACARRALASRGGAPGERALIGALENAATGRLLNAAAILDAHVAGNPCDLLAIKLAHGLRFMGGDVPGMLAGTSAALPSWSAATPGYGFVLGCHAFGLEESGDLAEAERIGRRAVECERADAWGLHAVAHVCEMEQRAEAGVEWLTIRRDDWMNCNNFAFHLEWHIALFHLAQDRADLALDLYDTRVRPTPTDDFRDIANAVSLLWRLRQEGVELGARWDELAGIARRRAADTTLMFACLHNLLTLAAVGDLATARALVAEIAACAARDDGDQSHVARTVGLGLAQAILSLSESSGARIAFADLTRDLRLIGGSGAQRDVFMRTLVQIAAANGEANQIEQLLAARRRLRRDDSFARVATAGLASAAA